MKCMLKAKQIYIIPIGGDREHKIEKRHIFHNLFLLFESIHLKE